MELTELFSLIQKTLAEQGFKLSPLHNNSAKHSIWVLDSELEVRAINALAARYTAHFGNCLEVRIAPHRNGAKADTSYYVAIESVDRSSYKDYKKIKLMRAQVEQTIVRKLTNLTTEYKQILADKKLADQLDNLLDQLI